MVLSFFPFYGEFCFERINRAGFCHSNSLYKTDGSSHLYWEVICENSGCLKRDRIRSMGVISYWRGMPVMYTTFCTPSDGNIIA